jgi:low temperature requirement protein LtrA
MRAAAYVTLAAALWWFWIQPMVQMWAQGRFGAEQLSASVNLMPFVVAACLFALVRIWRTGAELADFEEHAV